MRNPDNRFRLGLAGIILGGAVVLTGCASTGPKGNEGPKSAAEQKVAAEPAKQAASVEYINVVGDGDRVMIGASASIKYTAFKLSDPSRLIIDMPGVDLAKIDSAIKVDNDFLKEIVSVSYGASKEIGRITISLKDGVEHEVRSGDKSILVSLKKSEVPTVDANASAMKAASAEAAANAEYAAEPIPVVEAAPVAPEEAPAPALIQDKAKALAPATRILKVESANYGENTVVRIITDGDVSNFKSFSLDGPSRIVVDIWGVSNGVGKGSVRLADKYVKAVRIGGHDDKSRLVFDSNGKTLPPHSIARVNDTIVLTLGPKIKQEEKNASAKAAAPVAAIAPVSYKAPETPVTVAKNSGPTSSEAPASVKIDEAQTTKKMVIAKAEEPTTVKQEMPAAQASVATEGTIVEDVDFRRTGDKGRLSISLSAKSVHSVQESQDGKTVIIDIKGAKVPEHLSRTLDATKLKTAVAAISSYNEGDSARVMVKLIEKTPFEVTTVNGTINLEFAAVAMAEGANGTKMEVSKAIETKREYIGKRIDLDMVDANIADVLRLLAEVSNLNIIASDDVKGQVSIRLKDVPWDQAFEIILKSKELGSVREGNVVRVAPASKLRQETEAALASKKAQEKLEPLEIKFIPINYAKSDELLKQVKGVLSERGTVEEDKRTNTLIVKDVKLHIAAADNLVSRLDTRVPQVLIEARIVEASSSFARDLGIQWGIDFRNGTNRRVNTFGSTTQVGQAGIDPSQQTMTFTDDSVAYPVTKQKFSADAGATNYAVNMPATGTAGTLGAIGFLLGKTTGTNPMILDLRLSAGESAGMLKTISRPRITTMDNKEAKIEQGESIPFETTSASGTATSFVDANLSLTVTPHITPDGSVLMKIKASRNSIGTFRTSAGAPSINKKESLTEVLVRDGETTVIGGIVISDKNDSERGIPFLKDIPLLGWLFKSRSISDSQTELLIFITPNIVKEKENIVG
ncbi:MAG: type IV pilus secretin PilQ [Deltaproteobacteria bacterium]